MTSISVLDILKMIIPNMVDKDEDQKRIGEKDRDALIEGEKDKDALIALLNFTYLMHVKCGIFAASSIDENCVTLFLRNEPADADIDDLIIKLHALSNHDNNVEVERSKIKLLQGEYDAITITFE